MGNRFGQMLWLVVGFLVYFGLVAYDKDGFTGGGPLMLILGSFLAVVAYILFGPPWRVFND